MRKGINKSKINDEAWCPASFFIHYVLGISSNPDKDLYGGTNAHLLCFYYYDVVDFNILKKLELKEDVIKEYIKDVIIELIPKENKEDFLELKGHIIDRFAELEAIRIINLRKESKFKKLYYFPLMREKVLEKPPDYYGTPDAVWWLSPKFRYDGKKYKILIVDYKTGKVRPELMTSHRRELNVYNWLVSYITGIPKDEILGMIMQLGNELSSCNEKHPIENVTQTGDDIYHCSECDKEFTPNRTLYYEYSKRSGNATKKRAENLRDLIRNIEDDPRPDLFYPRRYYKKCAKCNSKSICDDIFKIDENMGIYFDEEAASKYPRRGDKDVDEEEDAR
jgi:hypothetical protein